MAPEYMKDRVLGVATFATSERRCFNFHKPDFKDPETAYLEESYVWSKDDHANYGGSENDTFSKYDAVIRVKVRAKNSMAAYTSEYIECPLIRGSFDNHAAFMHRMETRLRER